MYSFNEYQADVEGTAQYPDKGHNAVYPALGLAGEAGELAEKIKKLWRNHGIMDGLSASHEEIKEIVKEMGDVLWYLGALADEFGVNLDFVARVNVTKLKDRANRGVIKSEGDNR